MYAPVEVTIVCQFKCSFSILSGKTGKIPVNISAGSPNK